MEINYVNTNKEDIIEWNTLDVYVEKRDDGMWVVYPEVNLDIGFHAFGGTIESALNNFRVSMEKAYLNRPMHNIPGLKNPNPKAFDGELRINAHIRNP